MGVGGLVAVLLSLIGYFLHYLVQDLRELRADMVEMKKDCTWLRADNKMLRALVQTQLTFLRAKLNKQNNDLILNKKL